MQLEKHETNDKLPPLDVPVLVTGGIAIYRGAGLWVTGMEEPLYKRPLEWVPKWWAFVPHNI
jgi:hypothetical protein